MHGQIPLVRPGEPISARDINMLIEAVNALKVDRGGPAFLGRVSARVTRIYGNPIEERLGNVRYDIEAVGIGVKLVNVAPDYGRPFDEPDILIRPAVMGARCFLLRFVNDAGGLDYAVELPFGGKGERLSPSRCGNSAQRAMMRVILASGGGALPPAPPPGGDGPITGDGGGPVGGGEI